MTHTSSIMNSVNVLLNSTDKQLGMDLWERSVSWSPVPLDRDGPPSRRGAGTRSTVCDFWSLGFVSNTPVQVFNLFGNKRDTFKISMHKTARITSVECQRHH